MKISPEVKKDYVGVRVTVKEGWFARITKWLKSWFGRQKQDSKM